MRDGDDLGTGADVGGPQRQLDGIGAVRDADGMGDAVIGGKGGLERFDLRAEDEPAAVEYPSDGGVELLSQFRVLRP